MLVEPRYEAPMKNVPVEPPQRYRARMVRVLDHIDRHLDDDLDLDLLSEIAAFSKYHFHRQFTALFGLTVHRYVQLARFKRATHRLAHSRSSSVTDVALEAGYDAPDAFARAFRQRFGQAPSAFRAAPDWVALDEAFSTFHQARSQLMLCFSPDDVTICELPSTSVASMTHVGDPATIAATVARFIAWRQANGLTDPDLPIYGIFPTDTRVTPPAEFRMQICVATDIAIAPNDDGVEATTLPGGRVAALRVLGTAGDDLEPAALYLYRDWLPESGEELRDFPLYCERKKFFPVVAAHEAITDVFLPLR